MMKCVGLIGLMLVPVWPVYAADGGASYRVQRKLVEGGEFLVALPAGYAPGDRPALVVCLHGTETDAKDILTFWLTMKSPYPMVFVAPQSSGKGWRDTDAARVLRAVEWARRELSADWTRVLLTGHSAGGAMTFHLIYERDFPATAAATTANYLPPSIHDEEISRRRDLPVYYVVGTRDMNRERMRAGITILRSNGTSVTVIRPDIGHVLDAGVTQGAMDFFVQQNQKQVRRLMHEAMRHMRADGLAMAVGLLEPILDQSRYHHPDDVAAVEAAVARFEEPGRKELAKAEMLIADKQYKAAMEILARVEKEYAAGRLVQKAAKLREAVLAQEPSLEEGIDSRRVVEAKAKRLLETALELTRKRDFEQAKDKCRILLANYGDSRSAAGARRLLRQLALVSVR